MEFLPRHFKDGARTVDFVLVYDGDESNPEKLRKREIFEMNLEIEGLELERDTSQSLHFVQIYVPLEVLYEYGEILKIKVPLKKIPGEDEIIRRKPAKRYSLKNISRRFIRLLLNPSKFPMREVRMQLEFSKSYQELYDSDDPNFFDSATRIAIIYFILEREHFEVDGEEAPDHLGLEKLLSKGVYKCAYPVHGDIDRKLLLEEWAHIKKLYRFQPLDEIKNYFGARIALYFAWLGFYTHMLIPLSIIGVSCLMYGLTTLESDPISSECYQIKSEIMCPQCDLDCDYWKLGESCGSMEWNYLIDNDATILFAIVIAIWSVVYLQLWNRYSARLVHRWGLTDFSPDVEQPRVKYLARIRKAGLMGKGNTVLEPDVSFWRVKFFPVFTSFGITLMFISISVIAISSLIVYRLAQKSTRSMLGSGQSIFSRMMIHPILAAVIDLICITLLDIVFSRLAVRLTNLEYCRTQTEYDESLAIKNYIFEFVNYYSSIFYKVFLKEKFLGYPAHYERVFGFRQEECVPGGCLYELSIQLVIIMLGHMCKGIIHQVIRSYQMQRMKKTTIDPNTQAKDDYYLDEWKTNSLYYEYLKMVIQYGFMTLFGVAFPLAPLLALVTNIFTLRLDATKILKYHRRVIGRRANTIGVWHNIMAILTKIGVFTSSIVIAFSSNIVPTLVYRLRTHDFNLNGYLNFTLAYFDTKDFEVKPIVLETTEYTNVTSCRYRAFRNPPWHENPYGIPSIYWEILTARLAFIIIFQTIVGCVQALVTYSIPKFPGKLKKRIMREDFLSQEYIVEYVKKKAAERRATAKLSSGPKGDKGSDKRGDKDGDKDGDKGGDKDSKRYSNKNSDGEKGANIGGDKDDNNREGKQISTDMSNEGDRDDNKGRDKEADRKGVINIGKTISNDGSMDSRKNLSHEGNNNDDDEEASKASSVFSSVIDTEASAEFASIIDTEGTNEYASAIDTEDETLEPMAKRSTSWYSLHSTDSQEQVRAVKERK